MSFDVENQLVTNEFSLQIDESTISDNRAVLMAYVCCIDDVCKLCEEMLFVKLLETDATGLSIFEATKSSFHEKQIPLENFVSCATDGCPSMVGKHKGFIGHLKKVCPSILTVHCILHHQLVAKNLSPDLHESLTVVIKTVNKIKSHSKYETFSKVLH